MRTNKTLFNFFNKLRLVKKELENELTSCISSGRHCIGKSPVNTRNASILSSTKVTGLYTDTMKSRHKLRMKVCTNLTLLALAFLPWFVGSHLHAL